MTDHRSHPDQLMAQALGVCWHSPTSPFWPCTPLADWELELLHGEVEEKPCPDCGGSGTVRKANNKPYLGWAYREWEEPCPCREPTA